MPVEVFFNYLGYVKEDTIQQSFKIRDIVGKGSKNTIILTKDKFIEFTKIPSRPEVKRKVFLRLINVKEDEKEEKF